LLIVSLIALHIINSRSYKFTKSLKNFSSKINLQIYFLHLIAMKVLTIIVVLGFLASGSAALYQQCQGGKQSKNLAETVEVSGCKKSYCRLRKKYRTSVQIKFTPEKEIKKLSNVVWANIAGIPFPFIGVDGTSACNKIYEKDTKVSCPLKAGVEYTYKNGIDVLEIYPQIRATVHWALNSERGDVACFEVPVRITN